VGAGMQLPSDICSHTGSGSKIGVTAALLIRKGIYIEEAG